MGLINQLGDFTTKVSATADPLSELLKSKNEFRWIETHATTFQVTKNAFVYAPTLAHFDPTKPTTLPYRCIVTQRYWLCSLATTCRQMVTNGDSFNADHAFLQTQKVTMPWWQYWQPLGQGRSAVFNYSDCPISSYSSITNHWWKFLIAIALTISTTRVFNVSKKRRHSSRLRHAGQRAKIIVSRMLCHVHLFRIHGMIRK